MVPLEEQVLLDQLVQQEQQEVVGLQVQLVQEDQLDQLVGQVLKELMETQVHLDHQVPQEQQDNRDQLVQ